MTVKDAKYTPGPWRVATSAACDDQMGEIGHTVCVVIGDKIIHITHAGVAGMPDDYLDQRANARLIAAAPEMYEALDLLRQAWVTGPETPLDAGQLHDLRERAAKACSEALEKARGEAS